MHCPRKKKNDRDRLCQALLSVAESFHDWKAAGHNESTSFIPGFGSGVLDSTTFIVDRFGEPSVGFANALRVAEQMKQEIVTKATASQDEMHKDALRTNSESLCRILSKTMP